MAANEHEPVITIVQYKSTDPNTDDKNYNEAGDKMITKSDGTATYKFTSSDGSDAVQTGVETTSDIFYIWNNGENNPNVHDLKEPKLSLAVTKIADKTNLTDSAEKDKVIKWMKFKINNSTDLTPLSTDGEKINVKSLYQAETPSNTDPGVLKGTSATSVSNGKDKKIKLQFILKPDANEAAGQYSYTLTISGNYT